MLLAFKMIPLDEGEPKGGICLENWGKINGA
jgi:hypothetical protein